MILKLKPETFMSSDSNLTLLLLQKMLSARVSASVVLNHPTVRDLGHTHHHETGMSLQDCHPCALKGLLNKVTLTRQTDQFRCCLFGGKSAVISRKTSFAP